MQGFVEAKGVRVRQAFRAEEVAQGDVAAGEIAGRQSEEVVEGSGSNEGYGASQLLRRSPERNGTGPACKHTHDQENEPKLSLTGLWPAGCPLFLPVPHG